MEPISIIEPLSATNFDAATAAATASWDSAWTLHLAELKVSSNNFIADLVATLKYLNACAEPESEITNLAILLPKGIY